MAPSGYRSIGDRHQAANRYFDGAGEVRESIAWAIFSEPRLQEMSANGGVIEIFVKGGGAIDLQDLRQRLLILMRPAIGLARFTVSSNMMYG